MTTFVSKTTIDANTRLKVTLHDLSYADVGAIQLVRQSQPVEYLAPLTAATFQAGDNAAGLIVEPAGTIAALTVTMPAAPLDGQFWTITSTQIVSALTQNAAAGQTLNGAATALAVATPLTWVYHAANKTWYVAS